MKESSTVNRELNTAPSEEIVNDLKEVKGQIRNLIERQAEINQRLNEELKLNIHKSSEKMKNVASTNSDTVLIQSFSPEEEEKYEKLRELIIMYLKDLWQEKGQVTAQELVYAMPNQYSLADIYRTLEIMKERNQISWPDKRVNPQSILTLP
jgi:DNA polymerase II small subunit/DNA polymerase delta subunit B